VYESDWLDVVGLKADEVPEIIVLEGSWWRSNREKERLPHLSAVRELAAPDWWLGEYHDRRVLYACLYGAARAIEPIGILGPFGVRVAVQIGSCGGLAHVTNTGEYIVPTTVTPEDGVSRYITEASRISSTPALSQVLVAVAREAGHTVHHGPHVSEASLDSVRPEQGWTRRWVDEGYLGVDMETAAVFAAAEWRGLDRTALNYVWDEERNSRRWSDPLPLDIEKRRREAEADMFPLVLQACHTHLEQRDRG
jgi:uridine phosphorylase